MSEFKLNPNDLVCDETRLLMGSRSDYYPHNKKTLKKEILRIYKKEKSANSDYISKKHLPAGLATKYLQGSSFNEGFWKGAIAGAIGGGIAGAFAGYAAAEANAVGKGTILAKNDKEPLQSCSDQFDENFSKCGLSPTPPLKKASCILDATLDLLDCIFQKATASNIPNSNDPINTDTQPPVRWNSDRFKFVRTWRKYA
ncbi:MAG: hypothetical protein AB7F43_11735 [Bacteriovoracia bacterium]